jgi:hypothetical protein
LVIKRHAFKAACAFNFQITMSEKNYMGGGLPGNSLANGAMTSVIIDRIVVGVGFVMFAAAIVFMCHGISSDVLLLGMNCRARINVQTVHVKE